MASSSAGVIDIVEAIQCREELRGVVCSEPWLDVLIVRLSPKGCRWEYRPDAMPGGMVFCPTCNRLSPPHTLGLPLCCDCEVDRSQEWLDAQRMELVDRDEDFADELISRWWPRVSYSRFASKESDSLTEGRATHDGIVGERGKGGLGDDNHDAILLARHGDWPELPELDEPPKRLATRYDKLVRIDEVRERLTRPRKSDRRAPGCSLVVLSEKRADLLKEIAHFNQTQHLRPSTQVRVANPFAKGAWEKPESFAEWTSVEVQGRLATTQSTAASKT